MKQEETERMEVYYERIQKLAHGLQIPTIDSFLTIVFNVGLQSYFRIMNAGMKWSTLQQHKEATMLCEKGMTIVEVRSAILIPQGTKQVTPLKAQSNIGKIDKYCTNCGMNNHNVKTCKKKKEVTTMAAAKVTLVKNHKRHFHMHATSMV
jgi:hypothetical protein